MFKIKQQIKVYIINLVQHKIKAYSLGLAFRFGQVLLLCQQDEVLDRADQVLVHHPGKETNKLIKRREGAILIHDSDFRIQIHKTINQPLVTILYPYNHSILTHNRAFSILKHQLALFCSVIELSRTFPVDHCYWRKPSILSSINCSMS